MVFHLFYFIFFQWILFCFLNVFQFLIYLHGLWAVSLSNASCCCMKFSIIFLSFIRAIQNCLYFIEFFSIFTRKSHHLNFVCNSIVERFVFLLFVSSFLFSDDGKDEKRRRRKWNDYERADDSSGFHLNPIYWWASTFHFSLFTTFFFFFWIFIPKNSHGFPPWFIRLFFQRKTKTRNAH